MFKMVHFVFALILGFGIQAQAVDLEGVSVEGSVLYLSQDSGGSTTTVLPAVNYSFFKNENFESSFQLGLTMYKSEAEDKTFWIAAFRTISMYDFKFYGLKAGLILGFQNWEAEGTKLDIGLSTSYDLRKYDLPYIHETFLTVGTIRHDEPTRYVSGGLRYWF